MQEEHQQEPYFLRQKLLEAVDSEYNVKDMSLILEVLGKLEVLSVTKEILESTRLGKTVNEFRRRVNDTILAKRLKALVKKWRDAVLPDDPPRNHFPVNGTSSVSEGHGPGGNRSIPAFSSGYTSASSSPTLLSSSRVSPAGSYNSNSLSPRVGTLTNYNNNNTSVHSLAANRNGSSSISSRSPNYRNPQLQTSSYAALVSPSASTASPLLLHPRNLVSPHKSRSPGGPSLSIFHSTNSNLSPLPSSQFQSSISTYSPNAETVSRTNAANKRFRELDDSPLSASAEPPSKKSRSAVNGTLDDPLLALDDISRDSYASRGSDHSDGFTSKDNRFSASALSPATPGQASVLSPQMPVPGTDSNVPSPATSIGNETSNFSDVQPRRKRRKKNEFFQDSDAILREKIAQAQAEKAAKAARELQVKEAEEAARNQLDEISPTDKLANNEFVEKYLKSQTALRAKMERDAMARADLGESDSKGADEDTPDHDGGSSDKTKGKLKRDKKKHKKKVTEDISNANEFPSEADILSKLPPIDPEILQEFANYEYDVNPSPLPPSGDTVNTTEETESINNHKSLSTLEGKPRKIIDWGDSDDEDNQGSDSLKKDGESIADVVLSEQIQVSSEFAPDITTEPRVIGSEDVTNHEAEEETPIREVDDAEVESYIRGKIPNLNGNYDKDEEFREWHETMTVESYKGESLHILPYTIIDF